MFDKLKSIIETIQVILLFPLLFLCRFDSET